MSDLAQQRLFRLTDLFRRAEPAWIPRMLAEAPDKVEALTALLASTFLANQGQRR